MGSCIIGDGRDLTLDTGDGSLVMKNISVISWDVTISASIGALRECTAKLQITSYESAWLPDSIPRQIETYSVTDMLHMINAKLQERAE